MKHYVLSVFLLIVMCFFSPLAKAEGFSGPLPQSFADLVAKLSPAVVNISTTQTVKNPFGDDNGFHPFPPGHPFEDFNEFFEQQMKPKGNMKTTSLGSGFIISEDGYVVTNNHVINDAEDITITLDNNEQHEAEIIGSDPKTDLAVLKIKGTEKKFPFVTFGDSEKSRVGDWVIAIGDPFGLGGSVTAGIISARARDINAGPYDDFIQTDAAINRGNSGGPMFNVEGQVIGINTAIYSPSGGSVGIGFAIPSSLARPIIEQLKSGKKIKRGWLGVKIQTVNHDIAESLALKDDNGALVAEVTAGGPAEKAGFKVGDIIKSYDGQPINGMRQLPRAVASTEGGKKVDVVILREGKEQTLKATIGELKEEKEEKQASLADDTEDKPDGAQKILGMSVIEVNAETRQKYQLEKEDKGLLVARIAADSTAEEKGMRAGDLIVEAGQKKLQTVKDLHKVVDEVKASGRKSVLLLISRNGESIFVALPVSVKEKKKQ